MGLYTDLDRFLVHVRAISPSRATYRARVGDLLEFAHWLSRVPIVDLRAVDLDTGRLAAEEHDVRIPAVNAGRTVRPTQGFQVSAGAFFGELADFVEVHGVIVQQ